MKGDAVLVLDSQGPNALALCRTLGKKGLSVTAGGYTRFLPGMLSKYTDDSFVYPHPMEDRTGFVDALEAHLEGNDYAAVFPVTDLTTTVLAHEKDRLEATGTSVGTEDWETHTAANDKKRLFELAERLDVPSPETHVPESLADVERIDEDRSATVVIKPRRTTSEDENGRLFSNRISGTYYVAPEEDLVEQFRDVIDGKASLREEYPLVQEFVDGERTMCTVGLADEGELLATFQHRKFRVYPPSGGIGAVRQGVDEPRMRAYTERVVEALGWTGPVHVEWMKTHDGDFVLMEVNGRYWGSLALTINSGVDVPWLHYRQLNGESVPRRPDGYRTDVKQRKLFFKDLLWLQEQLSRGNVRALAPFTASFFTTRDEFLDPSDPLPFFGLGPRVANVLSNRLKGRSPF